MTTEERFWSKVDRRADDECWLWTGGLSSGYGRFNSGPNKRSGLAHRFAYELTVGPIPAGLTIDHLCRNRACVNSRHLEPVTGVENTMRGFSPHAKCARKTHCIRNHEFSAENTYPRPRGRECRICRKILRQRFDEKQREAVGL